MHFNIRQVALADKDDIIQLYQTVAQRSGGIAREADEITEKYVLNNLLRSLENGIVLAAEHGGALVGEIHCYQLEPRVFSHVLSELTIAVHPDFQGMGMGRQLFTALLREVEENRPDIRRVELITRESNHRAIELYRQLGFREEGRLEGRIDRRDGSFEADIPMSWFNKNFRKLSQH